MGTSKTKGSGPLAGGGRRAGQSRQIKQAEAASAVSCVHRARQGQGMVPLLLSLLAVSRERGLGGWVCVCVSLCM